MEATLEIFKDKETKKWYWTLTARNGQQIDSSDQQYVRRDDCVHNYKTILLRKWSIVG